VANVHVQCRDVHHAREARRRQQMNRTQLGAL
jgi:hypothetical protein